MLLDLIFGLHHGSLLGERHQKPELRGVEELLVLQTNHQRTDQSEMNLLASLDEQMVFNEPRYFLCNAKSRFTLVTNPKLYAMIVARQIGR